MLFLLSRTSEFITYVLFLLPEEFLAAFLAEQVCWQWLLSFLFV